MINTSKHDRGFTIVELVVVIVVIAILATISIVAYDSTQDEAKTTAGRALATQVSEKAKAYHRFRSTGSGYPAANTPDHLNSTIAPPESKVDLSNVIRFTTGAHLNMANFNDGQVVLLRSDVNGGCVIYWDYNVNKAASVKFGDSVPIPCNVT